MSRHRKNKNKNNGPTFEDGHYKLGNISIKEIMDKYPDKAMYVIDRKKETVLVLDSCKIIFRK